MSSELLLIVRIVVIVLIVVLVGFFGWNIWRTNQQEKIDGYERYRRSALDNDNPLTPQSKDDFITGNVEMRQRTSQLNPGFLGKKTDQAEPYSKKSPLRQKSGVNPIKDKSENTPTITLPYTLMARFGKYFSGQDIEKLVQQFELTRSPNDVFELVGEHGEVIMSMLNVRKPGVFPKDLSELKNVEGLLLILQLPIGNDPMKNWQMFNAVAHDMMRASNGRLCDYQRRPLGEAEIQRYRQAVQQFSEEYMQWLQTR